MQYTPGTILRSTNKKRRQRKKRIAFIFLLILIVGGFIWLFSGEKPEDVRREGAITAEVKTVVAKEKKKPDKPSSDETEAEEKTPPQPEVELEGSVQPGEEPAPAVAIEDESGVRPFRPQGMLGTASGEIVHSLYTSFARHFDEADPESAKISEQLAAHFKRLFFFDINFKKDLRPGDYYAFVWERTDESTDGIRILAAKFYSQLHEKMLTAYWFKDPNDQFARHYDANGRHVQRSLKNSPIPDYEQVTSLLKDRRPRHLGIDFKAPVGTPIRLPFAADVLVAHARPQRGNGRWIKVRYVDSGLEGLFLHLDKVSSGVVSGRRLIAGTPLGACGNSGRSFAPHLHYQVQKSIGHVLDPYKVHGYEYKSVSKKAKAAFQKEMQRLESYMPKWRIADNSAIRARH